MTIEMRRILVGLCALAGLGVAAPRPATAQGTTPHVFFACYVLGAGIVYRIKEAGLPPRCHAPAHVEFSWTDAAGGATDHGALSGLAEDDHTQYLLADGARPTTNGFAVTGSLSAGTIPATGAGVRLVWYPGKAAFRAGGVSGPHWDDANVGTFSTALGASTEASGSNSTALGIQTRATGPNSTALGSGTTASGSASTALGSGTTASGTFSAALGVQTTASARASTALGDNTTASGENSTAMGSFASTDGDAGSFVYGDASTTSIVHSLGANRFVVRAAGGTFFLSNADLTAGVGLSPGAGSWHSISDEKKKEHFADEDGERALARIAGLPVRSWNYTAQGPGIRHLGPTAQDFYAAFGLGESDTTISTVDADGVALLAVQALERRTAELRARVRELEALRAEHAALERRLARLEAVLGSTRATGAHPPDAVDAVRPHER